MKIVAFRTSVRHLVGKSASFIAFFLVGRSFQSEPAPCTKANYLYAPDGPDDQQCVKLTCDPKQSLKNKVFRRYFLENLEKFRNLTTAKKNRWKFFSNSDQKDEDCRDRIEAFLYRKCVHKPNTEKNGFSGYECTCIPGYKA